MSNAATKLKALYATAMVMQEDAWQDANRSGDWTEHNRLGKTIENLGEQMKEFDPNMLSVTLAASIEDYDKIATGFNCYDVARFLVAALAYQGVDVDRIRNDSESETVFIYAPERYRNHLKLALKKYPGITGTVEDSLSPHPIEITNWNTAREYLNAETA